jgi:NADPH:quinone reductase-like Zn-dependent oxidoreductase/SAM-dependent methyltransferase/acyl carrier protein
MGSAGRRRVVLPTYPFQRRRHWPAARRDSAPQAAAPSTRWAPAGGHPLLGTRMWLAGSREVRFESQVELGVPAYLGDHRIGAAAVLPLAAYLEMAAAAGTVLHGAGSAVTDLAIDEAMVLREGEPHRLQTVLEPAGPLAVDGTSLQIYSRPCGGASASEVRWRLHARGRLGAAPPVPRPVALDELRRHCPAPLAAEQIYEALAGLGASYGPRFRGLAHIWRGPGRALARIELPRDVAAGAAGYGLHPVMLDCAFQLLAAAALAVTAGRPEPLPAYLPIGVESLHLAGRPGAAAWAYAVLRPGSEAAGNLAEVEVLGDARLYGEAGELLAEVTGVRVRRRAGGEGARARAERPAPAEQVELVWQRADLDTEPRGGSGPALPPPARVGAAVRRQRAGGAAEEPPDTAWRRRLDELCAGYALAGLRQLEWEPRPGLVTEEGSLAASLGVVAGQRQLFGRLLEILAEEGVLRRCAEGWRVAELPAWEEPPALWQEVSAALPAWREELQLLRACGERLGPVLRGRCDPLQVLFPDGSVELLASLYERGAVCRQCNEVVRQLVEGALAEWAAGGGGRLRVLEIGAGTGGTTAALLAAIGERLGLGVEVVYTDVSARFLAHGQEKLGARAGLAFRLLDIERPPWEQGLARAAYDVVVAANVLHATADLRRSLAHVRWLLADQGWLVLVEGSERQRLLDLTFGMTEGWWKCAGAEDGRRGYPLLPPEGWREALGAAGFGECEVVWAPPGWGQAVVVAGGRAGARAAASRGWLVLSDRGGVGRRLREVLEARGERCVEVYRQGEEKWEAAGLSGSLAIDAAAPEAYRRLLAAGREAGEGREEGPWHRVVHLWGLDAADVELATEAAVDAAAGAPDAASGAAADGTERLLGAVTDLTRSVLYTVQALAAEGGEGHPGRLWLVTRGAQAVGADGELPHPASAVLWGLGRVVALEHPELRCVLLDLDPHGEAGESEALAAELDAAVGEDQIGRRAGRRLAARLRRADPPAGAAGGAAAAGELVQLDRPASGTLEHLAFRPFTRRPPHRPAAGEVELRVRASGVNFRDLLCVLGMYDGRPGGECAGEVTALGEGVEGLAVGDRVLAIAEASFDSLVTAPAALVVPLPPAMGFAAGAAIPVAFTTAWYALRHLAPVAAGTRVLIHSAAGGAGLAAVRLALAAGAEVHATASPAKWPFLRRLGVASVASSRSLDFAGTLLAATGGSGVDVALSSLTGDFIPATLAVLRQGGTFIEIGRLGTWDRERMARERPDVTYLPIALDRLSREQPEVVGAILRAVVAELAAGRIEPLPRQVFPASEIASAFRRMEQGKHIGKLVVVTRPAADAPGDDGRLALRADATYWIAGGLGGLGRLLAAWLAERGARHLVLSGRSAETGQPAAALGLTLPAGCQVAVRRADVARSEEVAEVLQHVRAALPPLAGVFHLAGSLRDGVLAQQSWEAFAAVLPAKVAGAWNLHLQTRELGLELFVLFSSAAALLGSPGQGNHAAANAFLDALAHHRRATGLPALAVGWGAWSEVGAAARAMAGRAGWLDLGLLAPAEGLRQLERLLTAPTHAHSGVLPAGWPAAAERLGLGRTPLMAGLRDLAPEVAPSAALAERLAQAPAAARAEVLSDHVRELVARVLALPPGHPIPAAQGFMDLGMDSLTAMELRNLLQHSLGRTLPATLVFDHPTMARLAAHLAQLVLAPAAAAPPPAGGEADRLERILRLTDEEVGARLAAARVERR